MAIACFEPVFLQPNDAHLNSLYLRAFNVTQKRLRILYKNRKCIPFLSSPFPFLTSCNFTGHHATLGMCYIASSNADLLPVVKLPTVALHAHIMMVETL